MRTVDFIRMEDGTKEEYEYLAAIEEREHADFPDRVLDWLRSMDTPSGYRITRLGHSLQSATRAHRAGKDEEFVVCCLLHDIGDMLAPFNHSEVAAALLRPYVSERNYWIVKHHGLFQGYYYFHHFGEDRNARDRYVDHQWYDDTVDFCRDFDQNCFDPDYDTLPLEFFEPIVRRLVGERRWPTP
jgi:predicted HD phosphohydrolase